MHANTNTQQNEWNQTILRISIYWGNVYSCRCHFHLSHLSLLSSPCHFVSVPLLFVPQFHCSVLQFQHFNISSNISRAESSVAELFSRHTRTHPNPNRYVQTRYRFMALCVDFLPVRSVKWSFLNCDPRRREVDQSGELIPLAIITIHSPVLRLMDDHSLTYLLSLIHKILTYVHTVHTHTPTHAWLPINQDKADGALGHLLMWALSWICDIFYG